jgi:hypothetical protein
MRSRVAALEAQRREFAMRTDELRRLLDAERGRTAQAQPQTPPVTPPASIASLILLPGLSRAETRQRHLELSSSTQLAHVEIELEPRDDYPQFRVEIRNRSGEEVLSQSRLQRRRIEGRYVVSIDVPATALAAGSYELVLKGVSNGKTPEDVGYYYFTVVRKG